MSGVSLALSESGDGHLRCPRAFQCRSISQRRKPSFWAGVWWGCAKARCKSVTLLPKGDSGGRAAWRLLGTQTVWQGACPVSLGLDSH